MKKLFNPYKKNEPDQIVQKKRVVSYKPPIPIRLVVIILGALFVFMVLLISGGRTTPPTEKNNSNDEIRETKPERTLPKGKLGDWAKAVVYIESGHERGDKFYISQTGTGFLINAGKYIITNQHVIEGTSVQRIVFFDGTIAYARVIRTDGDIDIALLKSEVPRGITALRINFDSDIQIATKIMVMGFPLGASLGTEITLTEGIISSVRKEKNGRLTWFQVSAAVNPGNSGGPLIDADNGYALGVITAKIIEADNIGFARPFSVIRDIFPEIND